MGRRASTIHTKGQSMTIRWYDGSTWRKFTDRELDHMSRQNARAVLEMLSMGAPVVLEHNGKYITDHEVKKELDGPCASFKSVLKKIPPQMLFKELMQ